MKYIQFKLEMIRQLDRFIESMEESTVSKMKPRRKPKKYRRRITLKQLRQIMRKSETEEILSMDII